MTTCLICASRRPPQETEVDHGYACPICITRISDDLDAIPRLATLATVEPHTSRGVGRVIPASRPPINLAGVDPALADVQLQPPPAPPVPLLEVLETWCRIIRDERQLTPYGPASAARAAQRARRLAAFTSNPLSQDPQSAQPVQGTTATLTDVTEFLRTHLHWIATQTFIGDLADEIALCRRTLNRWDPDHGGATVVPCPTLNDNGGTCGMRLRVTSIGDHEDITCPRCRVNRTTAQLLRIGIDSGDAWVDPEAAAIAAGVDESTLRRWARNGKVQRRGGRYSLADIRNTARVNQVG